MVDKFTELVRLLDEAYAHYFRTGGDACKSSDGYVSLSYGTFMDRVDDDGFLTGVGSPAVEIYSYVFGEGRHHYFDSIDEAYDVVSVWYEREMSVVRHD